MKPFKMVQRRKNLQLRKASFNLKDFFAKLIESPDRMYSKLHEMLNKNSDTLHAFVELGGLAKIYEYLRIFHQHNNESEVIRWLKILNHDNFPIDTDLIRTMGLGNFINKQIKKKFNCAALTTSIEQKWYRFAKNETVIHQNRSTPNTKHVHIAEGGPHELIFKRNDKPNKIKIVRKPNKIKRMHHDETPSILKQSTKHSNSNTNSNASYTTMDGMHEEHTHIAQETEYTLEYVGIQDEEATEMDISDDSNDGHMDICEDSNDDHIDFMNCDDANTTNNIIVNDIKETIAWHQPRALSIDHGANRMIFTVTEGMKQEQKRIGGKQEVMLTVTCVELDGFNGMNAGTPSAKEMPTDYPHWSEIEKYRKDNES